MGQPCLQGKLCYTESEFWRHTEGSRDTRTFGHRQAERIAVLASENKKFSVFIPTPSWYD